MCTAYMNRDFSTGWVYILAFVLTDFFSLTLCQAQVSQIAGTKRCPLIYLEPPSTAVRTPAPVPLSNQVREVRRAARRHPHKSN